MARRPTIFTYLIALTVIAMLVPGLAAEAQAPVVERLSGPDRFATAASVSAATFDPGVDVVYIATGVNFPDALAGGPLAGVRQAPVLLVDHDQLPPSTATELDRLDPARITVLGGAPAVSDAVVASLADHTSGVVDRLAGSNRFATAATIAQEGFSVGVSDVFVATGGNFPDALAAGAAGAANGVPVLLTNVDSVPAETLEALRALRPEQITVLGGPSAVAETVVNELRSETAGDVRRLAGPNRFATAAAIAAEANPAGSAVVYVATGGNFPDALSGGPAAATERAPLLLVNPECAPPDTVAAIVALDPDRVVVLGGTGAVSDAAAALTPCDAGSQPPVGLPLPTFVVDPAVVPTLATLPPRVEGDEPRDVARVADEYGTTTDFAERELVVAAEPGPELDALVARYDGSIVVTDQAESSEFADLPPVHLIRIDPGTVDIAGLPAAARATEPMAQGAHRVSSDAGLATIAASVEANADGMDVGLNILDEGTGILQETTTEAAAASAVPGFAPAAAQPYSTNAFDWAYMDDSNAQNIGVAEAWRRMDAAGVLFGNAGSVPVGVIDDGFGTTDPDRPANSIQVGAGVGQVGQFGCGPAFDAAGNPINGCPWHGHWVSSAVAAQVDNGIGAAGSGGPVSRLVMVQRGVGTEGTITSFLEAADNGARIMNMSFRSQVPISLNSSLDPLGRILNGLWLNHNRLFFAAAGNNDDTSVTPPTGADIDQTVCNAGGCFEPSFTSPCEFDLEVLCVGGVAPGARTRAPGSNFGTSVDIFGPFTVFVGADPIRTADQAQTVSGTSFASPVVAGVAALVWQAYRSRPPFDNPSNIAVYRALIETATASADGQVTRIMNAPAAVDRALGSGSTGAPTVQLAQPTGEITIDYGVNRTFEATASDPEDGTGCCTLRWTSDVDGTISVARQFFYAFPSPGLRTISVVATDSSGTQSIPATFQVNVVNSPPILSVSRQADGATLVNRLTYAFQATVSDPNEPGFSCSDLIWTSDGADPDFPAGGCRPLVQFEAAGPRTVTVNATDSEGATTVVTRSLDIISPPPNSPPIVTIREPAPGGVYSVGDVINLDAAVRLEDGEVTPVTYRWRAIQQGVTTELGIATTSSYTCNTPGSAFGRYETTLIFDATDDDGTGTTSVAIICERRPS